MSDYVVNVNITAEKIFNPSKRKINGLKAHSETNMFTKMF